MASDNSRHSSPPSHRRNVSDTSPEYYGFTTSLGLVNGNFPPADQQPTPANHPPTTTTAVASSLPPAATTIILAPPLPTIPYGIYYGLLSQTPSGRPSAIVFESRNLAGTTLLARHVIPISFHSPTPTPPPQATHYHTWAPNYARPPLFLEITHVYATTTVRKMVPILYHRPPPPYMW